MEGGAEVVDVEGVVGEDSNCSLRRMSVCPWVLVQDEHGVRRSQRRGKSYRQMDMRDAIKAAADSVPVSKDLSHVARYDGAAARKGSRESVRRLRSVRMSGLG